MRNKTESFWSEKSKLPMMLILVFCLGLFGVSSVVASEKTAPKRLTDAKAGDCKACHGASSVLPKGHKDTKEMTMEQCKTCHNSKKTSLHTKIPLGHIHHLQDVSCSDCHGDSGKFEAVSTDGCFQCHESGEAVAKLTEKSGDENPHNSPHYATDLDCELCHHMHKKSENYCKQCHDWALIVP